MLFVHVRWCESVIGDDALPDSIYKLLYLSVFILIEPDIKIPAELPGIHHWPQLSFLGNNNAFQQSSLMSTTPLDARHIRTRFPVASGFHLYPLLVKSCFLNKQPQFQIILSSNYLSHLPSKKKWESKMTPEVMCSLSWWIHIKYFLTDGDWRGTALPRLMTKPRLCWHPPEPHPWHEASRSQQVESSGRFWAKMRYLR